MYEFCTPIDLAPPLRLCKTWSIALRSTCGGQWMGRTRRTPAWRSTSAGRWRGRPDGSSDPDGVLPLGGSDDLDLDGGGSEGGDLLLHTVSNTGVHGGASGHDGVGVQV